MRKLRLALALAQATTVLLPAPTATTAVTHMIARLTVSTGQSTSWAGSLSAHGRGSTIPLLISTVERRKGWQHPLPAVFVFAGLESRKSVSSCPGRESRGKSDLVLRLCVSCPREARLSADAGISSLAPRTRREPR